LPLPSEIDTGTNSPITPASKSTAPTAMINRRAVTIGLPSNSNRWEGSRCTRRLNPGRKR
jgi:hypothetical protein